jgi:hypothetical protein
VGEGRLAFGQLVAAAGGFGLLALELVAAGVELTLQPLALLCEFGSRSRELGRGRFVLGARGIEFGLPG